MGIKHAYDSASSGEVENKPDAGLAVDPTECNQGPEIRDDVGNPGEGYRRTKLEPEEGQERRFYVYYLRRPDKIDPLEPDKGQPFYVGKGKKGNGRRFDHRNEAKSLLQKPSKKSIKIKIIHKLWRQGLDFIEEIAVDSLTEQEAHKIEIRLIATYGRINLKTGYLANLTNGGDGVSGLIQSEEARKKIGESNIGKSPSEETRRKIGRANKINSTGKRPTEETKQKMSEVRTGHIIIEETKEKIRQTNLGKPKSKETCEKMRRACIGRKPSKKMIEKAREANKGKKRKPETIEKIRQTLMGHLVSSETREKIKLTWEQKKDKEQVEEKPMPKTKEIEVSYGITVNLGNYESERVDLSMRAALEPGDEEDQVVNDYLEYLKGKCQEARAEALTRAHR